MAFDFEGNTPKRGRPRKDVSGVKLEVRVPAELAARIDREAAATFANRSDTIRSLLEMGLRNGTDK